MVPNMTSSDLDAVFTYRPNTPEQDEDLQAVYREARCLAETIYRRVSDKHAQQALGQLMGVVAVCKTAIESSPRQAKPLVLV